MNIQCHDLVVTLDPEFFMVPTSCIYLGGFLCVFSFRFLMLCISSYVCAVRTTFPASGSDAYFLHFLDPMIFLKE